MWPRTWGGPRGVVAVEHRPRPRVCCMGQVSASATPAQTPSPAGALTATGQSWFPSTPFTPKDLSAGRPDLRQRLTCDLARNASSRALPFQCIEADVLGAGPGHCDATSPREAA